MRGIGNGVAAPSVALRLLERFELVCSGQVVELLPACQRLVAFLGLHPRPLLRCLVVGKLWPETSERCAQHSLRTELHRLRRRCPEEVVSSTNTHVALNSRVAVDVRAQEAAVDDVEAPSGRHGYRELVDCLAGELLPGWYDEWVTIERERLCNRRLHALEKLSARLSNEGEHAAAIDAALRALAADPLRETAHRRLIEAHLREGNRAEAEGHWRMYRRLIRARFRQEPAFSWHDIAAPPRGTLTAV